MGLWVYERMEKNYRVDFDFNDAHDLNNIRDGSTEVTVKRKLKERFSSAKQIIVLIGEHTRYLYRFVRWELEVALDLGLPIIAVYLNGNREIDIKTCPPIILDEYVVHISFNLNIIKYALTHFPKEFANKTSKSKGSRFYSADVYKSLGL